MRSIAIVWILMCRSYNKLTCHRTEMYSYVLCCNETRCQLVLFSNQEFNCCFLLFFNFWWWVYQHYMLIFTNCFVFCTELKNWCRWNCGHFSDLKCITFVLIYIQHSLCVNTLSQDVMKTPCIFGVGRFLINNS